MARALGLGMATAFKSGGHLVGPSRRALITNPSLRQQSRQQCRYKPTMIEELVVCGSDHHHFAFANHEAAAAANLAGGGGWRSCIYPFLNDVEEKPGNLLPLIN